MIQCVTSTGRVYWVVSGVVYFSYTDALDASRSR